jgi:hypothetical protein
MKKLVLYVSLLLFTISSHAASFRCGRALVKIDESSNALIKKCGQPIRKFSSKEMTTDHGMQKRVGVSNWVYERKGKKDMIVSIYAGRVIKIKVD